VGALPCLIVERPEQVAFERLYWTPPVPYPDGRVMLKVGGSAAALEIADDVGGIESWFRNGGSTTEAAALLRAVGDLLPGAHIVSSDYKPCVMTYTPNEHPFVGFVDDGVVVAVGGNGSAAKSSDEIGRLATTLLSSGGWVDEDIEAESLAPVF
jgi:sarcosine oxidase